MTLTCACRCFVCSRQVVQPIERVLASRSDIKVGLVGLGKPLTAGSWFYLLYAVEGLLGRTCRFDFDYTVCYI